MLCGFGAIVCCLFEIRDAFAAAPSPARATSELLREFFPSYVAIGAYLIVGSMIFDALDGRLARIARKTSEFGAQLDSLSDIVSFGAAPVALFLTILLTLATPVADPQTTRLQWRVSLCCALVFLSCGGIRLARYNAENVKDESGQRRFSGLPTPAAAAAFISLILLHEDWTHGGALGSSASTYVLRWMMAPIAFGLGMLMISRVSNPHLLNVYFSRERPPTHLVGFLVVLGLLWWWPHVMLVVGAWTYVFAGLILGVLRRSPPDGGGGDDDDDAEVPGSGVATVNGRAEN